MADPGSKKYQPKPRSPCCFVGRLIIPNQDQSYLIIVRVKILLYKRFI